MATAPASVDPIKQGAFDILNSWLQAWGLSSLLPTAKNMITNGLATDAVSLELQATPQFKARFAGNTARQAAGLPVLSPADYLNAEDGFRQAAHAHGIPATFISRDYLGKLIGSDISPQEFDQRATEAAQFITQADPNYAKYAQQYYGLSMGAMVAHVLDPKQSEATITQQVNAVDIGTAALEQGGLMTNVARAQQLAGMGVTQAQAQAGYSKIGNILPQEELNAARSGLTYNQTTAENQILLNSASAQNTADAANSAENQRFNSGGGSAKGGTFGTAGGAF